MKKFPSWLIYLAAIGLGFFSFVISMGVLSRIIGSRFGGLPVVILVILISLAAAYFASKYSRRFMTRHISKASHTVTTDYDANTGSAQKRRIAMTLFFSGMVIFPVFVFMLLSAIINIYD